jgi:hypothetical protein
LLALVTYVAALDPQVTLKCNIKYNMHQPTEYGDFGQGLIMGLYFDQPEKVEDCIPCKKFGDAFGVLNGAMTAIFDVRDLWINKWDL